MARLQRIVKYFTTSKVLVGTGTKRLISMSSFQSQGVSTGAGVQAWQIESYGGWKELKLANVQAPSLTRPDQVLINVHAASVNPIDVSMSEGYGATVLNVLRQAESCLTATTSVEFPLTLGRDFAGTVAAKGMGVSGLDVGDEVWGVITPSTQGSLATTIVAPSSCVLKKPTNLTMVESASMVYAAMTAWSSLKVTANLAVLGSSGKSILVLGGSGGVGSMAVQLLQAWGATVTATCSRDAVPLVQTLGATAIDYTQPDFQQSIAKIGKFDVIFDCARQGTDGGNDYLQHLSDNPLSTYVTLRSPLLKETDAKGLVAGTLASFAELIQVNLQPSMLLRLAPIRWGFFMALPPALQDITNLATQGKLKPCVDTVFGFEDVPKAFEKLKAGHARGKMVINMTAKS